MSWRESFMVHAGPGLLGGTTIGRWLKVLRDNQFAVDPPYWLRALSITSASIPNTFHAWREERLYGRQIRKATVHPPIFILGIWRSGTTLLHNLLAVDDRFAYANNYQTCYPLTFLTTEAIQARFVGFFLPPTRPQDNVRMGIDAPQEDEFAFCSMNGLNFWMGWSFPRTGEHYKRFLSFREASPAEVADWKAGLAWLVQKLSFKYGKPLLLKSPGHTARIRLLLELYPEARFIHIRRHPYDVHRSTLHLARKIVPWVALQHPDWPRIEEETILKYNEVYDAYFADRHLIPPKQLYELAFEDLESDPIGQIRAIYNHLDLPEFGHVEPRLTEYIASLSGYKKNEHAELPLPLRERLAREWRQSFEAWDYSTDLPKIPGPSMSAPTLD
jgi:hypothetical protein